MNRTPTTHSRRRSAHIEIVRELQRDRRLAAARRGRGEPRIRPPRRTVAVRPNDAVRRFLELTRDA